jgi:nitrogen fixation protein NifZ
MTAFEEPELDGPPRFERGEKVCSTRVVKNDGTFLGKALGEVLVTKGEVGYVRDVGTFLQRFYVYAVEFIERGAVVGMRGRELKRAGGDVAP